jgi:glycosyltransferase involved in cell wall biosynthesis
MALIDIIVPTYNRASVLPETLKSLQRQTFSDWHCFIAEDGETPETRAAVAPFLEDARFTYLPGMHAGVPAAPRNRAIRQGRSPFIAFLDDDDLWLPEKLETQLSFMNQHPDCVLLGANAYRWNGKGSINKSEPCFLQAPPAKKLTFDALVADNAIINSTAILRRSVLSRSGMLNEALELAAGEDYELWLRIAPLGEVWILNNVLAAYRDAPSASIREGLRPHALNKKLISIFSAALRGSITARSPLTYPENRRFGWLCRKHLVRLRWQEMQQRFLPARKVFRQGLLACGRGIGWLCRFFIKKAGPMEPAIFMLFPFYHTGGAERVHAQIINCLQGYRPWVFICCKSKNKAFKKAFSQGSHLFDISLFCENRFTNPVIIGCLTEIINRTRNAVVFGCNSFLFYDSVPFFSEKVKTIDLTHAFGGLTEVYSLPLVPLLDNRVTISMKTVDDFALLYAANGIDSAYLERIKIIENKVPVPEKYNQKSFEKMRVVYVGRGTAEKRVHLIGNIAKKCAAINPDISFTLIGDVEGSVLPEDRMHCIFKGEIDDDAILNDIYRSSHIILITSEREGLPLVLMEAMAYGVVPITTNVGAISAYVQSGLNGFLIEEQDENFLVEAFAEKIKKIFESRDEYHRLSRNAYQCVLLKAAHNDDFCREYVRLLSEPKRA